MKGGRTAPRKFYKNLRRRRFPIYFNEGGADCPPKEFGVSNNTLRDVALQ